MRIIFMGNYEEGKNCVSLLYDKGCEICAVFTDFGNSKPQNALVKKWSLEHNIPVYPQNSLKTKDIITTIKTIQPDLIVVVNLNVILVKEISDFPKYGAINLHSSLLPKYRGRAPLSWAIINDEEKTGISIYFIDEGIDTGKIIIQKEMKIDYNDTVKTLLEKQWEIEPYLVLEAVKKIKKCDIEPIAQKEDSGTYYPWLSLENRIIDWNKSSRQIYNLVRALVPPYPGAVAYWKGMMITVLWGEEAQYETNMQNLTGVVVNINEKGILISCGKSGFYLKELEVNNEKISFSNFIFKYGLKIGDRLK